MFTIIGKERKVGTYEGREYDNTILYCTYLKEHADGLCVIAVKVKTANLDGGYDEVSLGEKCSFLYDRYGNVARVDFV